MRNAHVRVALADGVATLVFDRPPVNAIDNDLIGEASEQLARLESAADVRALVVTGAGACFSAGLDLKQIPRYSAEQQQRTMHGINELLARLYALPVPTVAAINGHAIAGGLVIALACDYRVATSGPCQLGLTEARAGIPFPAVAIPRDAYTRIKHQLRADAIAANRTVLERGDPLAQSWLSRDVASAAAALLERKPST